LSGKGLSSESLKGWSLGRLWDGAAAEELAIHHRGQRGHRNFVKVTSPLAAHSEETANLSTSNLLLVALVTLGLSANAVGGLDFEVCGSLFQERGTAA
jgi:hypothetical protein